ncbi:MAG: acyltransferase family protein, partial [Parafilimonas terrae]|nr:acyltransferase family protein [Parafilimonas terrae]
MGGAGETAGRLAWVDVAKGICILLVVMMHSVTGTGEAMGGEGFMHPVVAFAKPFRIPDFFLLSGLFMGRVIDRDWRLFSDRRVVHFAYFYLLWLVIQSAARYGKIVGDGGP